MRIELKNISKSFEDATPIKEISTVINEGDVISIIGPSGTGKSTLLRCINLLDPPNSGEIYIDCKEITKDQANAESARKRMGMVFQSYNLFNHLTVVENVMFALIKIKNLSKQEAYDIAMEQLKLVNLDSAALKYPDQLSGGQKQRVSIARTLAMDPELILFDEPTSALDPSSTREIEGIIADLKQMGKTMLIVTHELRFAKAISNRVFFLDKGIIFEDGTPNEIFENPKHERTRSFVQQLKVLHYKFSSGDFSYIECQEKVLSFVDNNDISTKEAEKITDILEKLFSLLISKYIKYNFPISLLIEYSKERHTLNIVLYYYAENESVKIDFEEFMKNNTRNSVTESIEDKDFNFKVSGEIDG